MSRARHLPSVWPCGAQSRVAQSFYPTVPSDGTESCFLQRACPALGRRFPATDQPSRCQVLQGAAEPCKVGVHRYVLGGSSPRERDGHVLRPEYHPIGRVERRPCARRSRVPASVPPPAAPGSPPVPWPSPQAAPPPTLPTKASLILTRLLGGWLHALRCPTLLIALSSTSTASLHPARVRRKGPAITPVHGHIRMEPHARRLSPRQAAELPCQPVRESPLQSRRRFGRPPQTCGPRSRFSCSPPRALPLLVGSLASPAERPLADRAPAQTSYRAIPTLSASVNAAPSLVPNILDPTAPNAQDVCPGYRASNIVETSHGLTADLNLAGAACNVYGNDIAALSLSVEYQSRSRLNVRIVPRYIAPSNQSQYILSPYLTGLPAIEGNQTLSNNELNFTYTNQPSFQFEVARAGSGDVIFSTFGKVIVFEDQFLELATSMPANYNVYGLAENIHQFRLGNNYTQTFFNADSGNPIDGNLYGTHPMYLETRYHNGSASTSHGVYARNAHGQEWLLRATNITYRTLGGSFDFYFLRSAGGFGFV